MRILLIILCFIKDYLLGGWGESLCGRKFLIFWIVFFCFRGKFSFVFIRFVVLRFIRWVKLGCLSLSFGFD